MTSAEFKVAADLMCEHWNTELGFKKMDAWYRVLGGLTVSRLLLTIESIPAKNGECPELPAIIARYEAIKQKSETKKQPAKNTGYQIPDYAAKGQHQCSVCSNTGDIFFMRDGYQYHCRCSCARGSDLNRWGHSNYPRVNDVLTHEDIEIIKAKNLARRELPRPGISEIMAVAGKIGAHND